VTSQLDAFLDATRPQPEIREGYNGKADGPRLTRLLDAVRTLMLDGHWRTLREIVAVVGHSEAGVSARLRELRHRYAGGYTVLRKRIGDPKRGLWAYKVSCGGDPGGVT
jgi:hypothetical protein